MGARVYLPTSARFLQTDPIDGGTANAYTYVNDPINSSDYSGLLSVGVARGSNIRLTVTYNYGMQYGWGGNSLQSSPAAAKYLQPTAPAARIQGPGSMRSSTGRTSGPETVAPVKTRTVIQQLGRVASSVASISSRAGRGLVNYTVFGPTYLPRAVYNAAPPEVRSAAASGCVSSTLGATALAIAYSKGTGAPIALHPYALGGECALGAAVGVAKEINPNASAGYEATNWMITIYNIVF